MWFLFVEIFFLLAVSFLTGAGLTRLALKVVLKSPEAHASDAGRVIS